MVGSRLFNHDGKFNFLLSRASLSNHFLVPSLICRLIIHKAESERQRPNENYANNDKGQTDNDNLLRRSKQQLLLNIGIEQRSGDKGNGTKHYNKHGQSLNKIPPSDEPLRYCSCLWGAEIINYLNTYNINKGTILEALDTLIHLKWQIRKWSWPVLWFAFNINGFE